ncbi:hypothetical protein [uncultured Duncaniella sp.]|uniref:hypothetical protein n=1 Tax=uncultured Duncaniella sp. TaxID=2768039 RepID=UPI0025B6ADCB|nr:hypothetical protein [uncultured Duncaniella sp.]
MKHLFTKLLLVMCMLFGPAVAARSFHCNIIGNANFMDTKTPQSSGEEGSWKLPGAYQLCDATGDLYFWATGKFKLSQVKKDETNMDTWTSSAFKIDSSNITWNSKSASDLGATSDSPKFVHLAIRPNGGNFVEVKDAPFAGYEGVWSDYVAPLPSLYIGGSWGGSENWWTPVKIEATETSYKDYVVTTTKNNAEFRFYSIDNPTSSDSDKSKWFGASGENNMTVSTDGTNYTANSSALKTFVISEPGTYTIKVSEFSGSSVKFSVVKSSSAYNNSLYVGIASSNRHQIQPAAGGGYAEYKFYVNEEDLKDSDFGFRFYSEPNAGTWMGADVEGTTIEFDTEYTTTGIKRYWINAAGAYSIKVKSYDSVKNQVVFSITKLEGDVVLEPLYIGGTWDNTLLPGNPDGTNSARKTRIESQRGKYKPFKVTVPANSQFMFFSAETGGDWMGAVLADGTAVDSRGTLSFTTKGGSNKFKFVEAGTYEINVSEYIPKSCKVTFTAKLTSGGSVVEAPETLYLRNSRDNWNNVVPMTYDAETQSFSAKVSFSGEENFEFHFYERNASDWSDRGVIYYPEANTIIDGNSMKNIDKYDAIGRDPETAWAFGNKEKQDVTVRVIFGRSVPVVEIISESPDKNYYFIGDLNDWFSNEFDGNLKDTDIYGETIAQGINKKRWDMNSEKWKFEYVGDGWYRFNGFPDGLLTGHFQILTNPSWVEGEIYSHMVNFSAETLSDELYKAFKMNRITRDDIRKGREYRIRKRPAGEGQNGLNLGTECSAVENAVLYFYPGNDVETPRIRLEGAPKDYFIFYNMEEDANFDPEYKTDGDGTNQEYWVRAKINSGKPNSNNYFLAGIKYGDLTLPFYDINGNSGPHMNLNDGIDLAPYALKDLSEVELNDLFFGQQDIVQSILREDKLPNGRDISVYDNVWVAKVPSGFENPAGTKYSMTFTKAMTEADRNRSTTITPRHLYFFPQVDGVHVHINTDDITEKLSNVASVDVAYRVYKTDNNYNTIAILHGNDVENGRATKMLHPVGSVMSLTEKSETREIGWYELVRKDYSLWGSPSDTGYADTEWMVSWDPAVSDAETAAEATDCRREIPYDDNSAFVQFRLTINLKTPLAVPGRSNAPVKSYTVYVPDRVNSGNDKYHFSFNNNDLYVKPLADSDAVWTEVNQIIDEINGNVDPGTFETVYYNLQGVRVDNPTSGVYIRVRGNKSDKVVF